MIHLPLWAFIVLLLFAIVGFCAWTFITIVFALNLDRHVRTQRMMRDPLQQAVDKVSARHYQDGGAEL